MNKFHLTFSLFIFFFQISLAQQTVGLFINDPLSFNGYTLFAPKNGTTTYLIDNCGFLINTWENSATKPGETVYLLENGNLLKVGSIANTFYGAGTGGGFELYNWEGDLIWSYNYEGMNFLQHHDIAPLPNGNILLLSWDRKTNDESIIAGRDPSLSTFDRWSEKIVEIKPIGTDDAEIVWEWFIWDHLIQDFDVNQNNFGVIADHPELVDINYGGANQDWLHLNSIDYNPAFDQILFCSRHLNEVYIIDHSTTTSEAASHTGGNSGQGGDILFRWGNPLVYNRGEELNQKLFGPHDARWIPAGFPDENKIMVFNNGFNRPAGDYSTVEVINPPIQNNFTYSIDDSSSFEPSNSFWQYEANPSIDFYSSNMSSAQRLPNGNTLILEGQKGNIFEVTYEGNIVWNYKMPISSNGVVSQGTDPSSPNLFRAIRYGTDYPAFIGKDLTPGDPIELYPLPSTCEIFGITNTNSLNNDSEFELIKIMENPIQDFLLVKNKTEDEIVIEVFNLVGLKMISIKTADEIIQIPSSTWGNGIYVVRFLNTNHENLFSDKIYKK